MLKCYLKGREILKEYEELDEKPVALDDKQSSKITHSIMDWAEKERISFSRSDLEYLANEIVKIFDCEELETYFTIHSNGRCGGILFHRYDYTMRKDKYSTKRKIERSTTAKPVEAKIPRIEESK